MTDHTEPATAGLRPDDERLLERFRGGTLGADELPHAEHVRIAWLYLERWPLLEVLERFPADLRRFAESHGAAGRYHATVTWAWIFLIDQRRRSLPRGHDWPSFARAHADLVQPQGDPLLRYYHPETLGSAEARAAFVLPDRALDVGNESVSR